MDDQEILSNADLKHLLEKTLVRFENWKLQVEQNPNPRMVHSLKNIVSIIDSVSQATEQRTRFSYKTLSQKMAILLAEVSSLNTQIVDSLRDDDIIDEKEEKLITRGLMEVIRTSVELIRFVQSDFGLRKNALSGVDIKKIEADL
jgi:ParB-like chromosome segregation protein Spo0J